MGTKTKTSWNKVLFDVKGTLEFEIVGFPYPSEVHRNLHNAIIEADRDHPWGNASKDRWGSAPSLGLLKVGRLEDNAPLHFTIRATVGPFQPIKPGQLCAYQRYLETLAANALKHIQCLKVGGVRVSMRARSCFGNWITPPPRLPIMQRLEIQGSVDYMGKTYTKKK